MRLTVKVLQPRWCFKKNDVLNKSLLIFSFAQSTGVLLVLLVVNSSLSRQNIHHRPVNPCFYDILAYHRRHPRLSTFSPRLSASNLQL